MRKVATLVVLAMVLVVSGCATSTTMMQVEQVTVAGRSFTYVFGESRDHTGIHQKVVDRYDEYGKLIESSSASGEGILQKVVPAVISGGAMAGGLIGAASVMPADTTTVSQTSTSSNSSSATAPTTVTSNPMSFSTSYSESGASSGSSIVTPPPPKKTQPVGK